MISRSEVAVGDAFLKQNPCNFVEMGFEDRRKKTNTSTCHDSAWVLLREFAKHGGTIERPQQASNKAKWANVETGVGTINKKLKALFRLSTNPIEYQRNERRYRTAFTLEFPDSDRI